MRSDRTMRRPAIVMTLAGLLGLGLGGPAGAQAPGAKATRQDDAASHALLEQVADAYKALSSYSDQGEFVVAMTLGGKSQRQARPLRLTFVRPNKLDLDAGTVRLTSDGKTLTTAIEPLKKYMTAPAPAAIDIDTFREGPTGAVLFGGPTAAPTASPMYVLLNLLAGANPDVMLDQMGGTLRASGTSKDAMLIDMQEGPDLLLTVDPATKLLSAIELKIDPAQLEKSAPPGQSLTIERFGWTSGTVATKVPADRSFAFAVPKGFTPIDAEKDRPALAAAPKPQYAVQEKLGKPAPEFTLTVLDGPGKTRTLGKADLAGKVVVIDFWATWCGPCLMELPQIQKLVEHYADRKDVLVVALSQDDHPVEISEVRKLVEKTLADKKIDLTKAAAGRIGLDPSNSVGKAFDVEGYPTLVILDGKGVVQSAHVGYNPEAGEPLHKTLATEIDALLGGKPLAGEKGKDAKEKK